MANYIQYNKEGDIVSHRDLQDKVKWCIEGEETEEAFVRMYGDKLGVEINPDKKENPYVVDLIQSNGVLADLKTQNTPFFKAEDLFNLNPSYAAVFNRKDLVRYQKFYPDIDVYFWIEWHSVKFEIGSYVREAEYVNGVWKTKFKDLAELTQIAHEHFYKQRKNDKSGNAKSSFIFDIRSSCFTKVI